MSKTNIPPITNPVKLNSARLLLNKFNQYILKILTISKNKTFQYAPQKNTANEQKYCYSPVAFDRYVEYTEESGIKYFAKCKNIPRIKIDDTRASIKIQRIPNLLKMVNRNSPG